MDEHIALGSCKRIRTFANDEERHAKQLKTDDGGNRVLATEAPKQRNIRIDGILKSKCTPAEMLQLQQRLLDYVPGNLKCGVHPSSKIRDFALSSKLSEIRVRKSLNDGIDKVRLFRVHSDPIESAFAEDQSMPLWQSYKLPHEKFDGKWDNLFLPEHVKLTLMMNVKASLVLSDSSQLNRNLLSWNKMCLIHGPPGTGKTSICKALSHEIAASFQSRYQDTYLLEINTHSIFSKFFSESGKQVLGIFTKIKALLNDDRKPFVIVLIDEVESLSSARSMAMNRNEPSDAVRVVNAMLTQIDSLQDYSNCLVMTTSNMLSVIDEAFLDRVDFEIYIGNPGKEERCRLLIGSIGHLMDCGIIIDPSQEVKVDPRDALEDLVNRSEGMTGRTLRKLPYKALVKASLGHEQNGAVDFNHFIACMNEVVDSEKINEETVKEPKSETS